jgi:hypothetical protein
MRINRAFYAPISDTVARQRAVNFLIQSGYRQLPDSSGSLHFRRGSVIGTLANFDPTRWVCSVNVLVTWEGSSSKIDVESKIANDPFEKRFAKELLTSELSRLETAITTDEFSILDVGDLKKRISSHVYHVVRLFASFIVPLVFGIIAGIFAFTNLNISPLRASTIGAGVFLILLVICLMVWHRQKKH